MLNLENLIVEQNTLFGSNKNRTALASIQHKNTTSINIQVHRNHVIENLIPIIDPYYSRNGKSIHWTIHSYDDSLSYQEIETESFDLELVWFDLDRVGEGLSSEERLEWFASRLLHLARKQKKPVLSLVLTQKKATNWNKIESLLEKDGIQIYSIHELLGQEYISIIDLKRESLTGSKLSAKIHLSIAPIIGGQLIPCSTQDRIKAVFFDLDNTLYDGVLGEDGIHGIKTEKHQKLYGLIRSLKQSGIFLGILSKNDESLVNDFFGARGKELGLQLEDFTVKKINWDSKSKNFSDLCTLLKIGEDAVLFVDDNPSELLDVGLTTKCKSFVYSPVSEDQLCDAIRFFPGVWRNKVSDEDRVRSQDILANQIRETLAVADEAAYFQSLGMKLRIEVNPTQHFDRCVELSNKTNQFNSSFKRYSAPQMRDIFANPQIRVVTVSLSDKLSDSGIIGMLIVGRHTEGITRIHEMVISCRALGRKIEDVITLIAARKAFPFPNDSIVIDYKPGNRNEPIVCWIKKFSPSFDRALEGSVTIQAAQVQQVLVPEIDVDVTVNN